jgi:hypothetical protein
VVGQPLEVGDNVPKEVIELFSPTCGTCGYTYGPTSEYTKVKAACCKQTKITRLNADAGKGANLANKLKVDLVPTIVIDGKPMDPTSMSRKQLEKVLCDGGSARCEITK